MNVEIVNFTVSGYCQPWQRPINRAFAQAPESRQYQKLVWQLAHLAMKGKPPWRGFLGVEIEIICQVPKSWSKNKKNLALIGRLFPTSSDLDNCAKNFLDAMNRVVYEDDRFINHLTVRREYGPEDKATVTVYGLESPKVEKV